MFELPTFVGTYKCTLAFLKRSFTLSISCISWPSFLLHPLSPSTAASLSDCLQGRWGRSSVPQLLIFFCLGVSAGTLILVTVSNKWSHLGKWKSSSNNPFLVTNFQPAFTFLLGPKEVWGYFRFEANMGHSYLYILLFGEKESSLASLLL